MTWQDRYMKRFYYSHQWINGTAEFWNLCSRSIAAGACVLEIGAGPTNPTSEFLARQYELHGVDVDPDVQANVHLRTHAVYDGETLPFANSSFDACVSNYVVEHVQNPAHHLAEVHRVLKPGGVYVLRTPNRFHYVAGIAQLTPHWVHELLANRLRNLKQGAHDPYPTVYRLNSQSTILRGSSVAGFAVRELRRIEKEPSYGMSSRLLFLAFMAYERAVNATELLAPLRANILASLQKSRCVNS